MVAPAWFLHQASLWPWLLLIRLNCVELLARAVARLLRLQISPPYVGALLVLLPLQRRAALMLPSGRAAGETCQHQGIQLAVESSLLLPAPCRVALALRVPHPPRRQLQLLWPLLLPRLQLESSKGCDIRTRTEAWTCGGAWPLAAVTRLPAAMHLGGVLLLLKHRDLQTRWRMLT